MRPGCGQFPGALQPSAWAPSQPTGLPGLGTGGLLVALPQGPKSLLRPLGTRGFSKEEKLPSLSCP